MTKEHGESSYRRVLEGDKKALEALLGLYGDSLVRFAYCYVKDSAMAEDIMEEAFATLLVKKKRFSGEENLRAYLYKITRNRCIDYLRWHKRRQPLGDMENVLVGEDLEETVGRREQNRVLYRSMQTLPEQYADILYLVYFEGYKIEEAAAILKKSKKQVYNLLARAKSSLKDAMQKEGFYENE